MSNVILLVVVADLNEDLGGAISAEIGGAFAKTDVNDEAKVQAAVDAAGKLGPLLVLINCAGLGSAARMLF